MWDSFIEKFECNFSFNALLVKVTEPKHSFIKKFECNFSFGAPLIKVTEPKQLLLIVADYENEIVRINKMTISRSNKVEPFLAISSSSSRYPQTSS